MFNFLTRFLPGRGSKAAENTYPILYTRGNQLLTPQQYRASFEQELFRSMGGHAAVDDHTLARAFGASAAAYTCTEYRATVTAGFPLITVNPSGEVLEQSPLSYFLNNQAGAILHDTVISLLLWGRAYLQKRRNQSGYPTGLKWLNPLDVREFTDGQNRVLYYDVLTPSYRYERVEVRDVIYMQLFDTRSMGRGLSKFEAAWRAIGIDFGIATYAAAFFINGAQPDGVLSFDQPLKPDQIEQAQKDWQQVKGARNAHRTAVMPPGVKWTAVQPAPKDLALSELKAEEREDICAIFQVDPILVGLKGAADPLSANSTYSKTEVSHIRNVALPLLKLLILAELNRQWAHRDFDVDDYYSLKVDEGAIPALAEAHLAKAQTAESLTGNNILDYDEGRKLLGYPDRGDYFIRSPEEAVAVFEAGGLTYHELRKFIMGIEPEEGEPDLIKIAGSLYPRSRLLELADANVDRIKQMAVGQTPWMIQPTTPTQPPTQTPPALPETTTDEETRAGRSLCIALNLANQPDLIALQGRVKAFYHDIPVEWNAPDDFHVTLLYAPVVDETQMAQILASLDHIKLPELRLAVGSLKSFDNLGNYALHFRIRRNADLLALHQSIYDLVTRAGVQVSAYSTPEAYIPHITMGYAAQKPRGVTFNSSLSVTPTDLVVWVDDEVVEDEPQPAAPLMISTRAHSIGEAGCSIIIPLEPDVVVGIQRVVRAMIPDSDKTIRWTDEIHLHVTLLTAEIIDDEQVRQVIDVIPANMPVFDMQVGPLDVFDHDDQLVLILRVESEQLRALQRTLYEKCVEVGATLSGYADPEKYQPHITLAYAQAGVEVPEFNQVVTVQALALEFSRIDYMRLHAVEFAAMRAISSLSLGVSFAENQFVKYARRELAASLGEVAAEWIEPSEWRLVLVQVEPWSPTDAAKLIRAADYADVRKIDVAAGGYELVDGVIYLRCEPNAALDALRTSIELDLQAIAQQTIFTPFLGIPLCKVTGAIDLSQTPATSYPLVANNVTLYKTGRQQYQWQLRGVSSAQTDELQKWERMAKRKGAEYQFRSDVLAGTEVEAFVREALDALVEVDDVFDMAFEALRGELDIRAYFGSGGTREQFMESIGELFEEAQASEIGRRKFGASLRMHLRRFGLQAFRDGMNEVGYDPESLGPEELASFREWQAEQSKFVTNLGAEIFGQGITVNEVENRVRMWADISLNDARLRGIEAGNAEQRLIWVLGAGEINHCDDCPRLDGQVHTAKAWRKAGFRPGNGKTQCRQGCKCRLELTDEPERGDFL